MWRLTWEQMRRTAGRLVAVGVAVALGTAFITTTFLATATIERTALAAARAGIGEADLVVKSSDYSLTDADLTAVSDLAQVSALQPLGTYYREVTTPRGTELLGLLAPAPDPRLEQVTLLQGAVPTGADEIVLPAGTADRLGAGLGDSVTLVSMDWSQVDQSSDDGTTQYSPVRVERPVQVVGIAADGSGLGFSMPLGLASAQDIAAWRAVDGDDTWAGATLLLTDGADAATVQQEIQAISPTSTVLTGDAYARDVAASFTGGVQVFQGLVLAFAAVAMAVAGIVIANTFTVLVAQRTRTLALLRCVGATRAQVRSSVRREALLLGVIASLVGIGLGIGVGQLVLTLLGRANDGVPLPAVVPIGLAGVLVPLVVGVVVTVVAAGGAARAATRVAPLAALQPAGAETAGTPAEPTGGARRAGRATRRGRRAGTGGVRGRVVTGWVLLVLGVLAMAGAVALGRQNPDSTYLAALALGVLGGLVSMVGVVMAARWIVPALVRAVGGVLARLGGSPARLAATNAARNPARTTSTATALIVGVSLVTMMATGAATARHQLDTMLTNQFAIDAAVTSSDDAPLPVATVDAVRAVDGVTGSVLLDLADAEAVTDLGQFSVTAAGVADTAALLDVVHSAPEQWQPGTAFADGWILNPDGPITVNGLELDGILLNGLPDYTVLLDAATFQAAGLTPQGQALMLSLDPDADPQAVMAAITEAVSSSFTGADLMAPSVTGGVVERAGFAQIVDTLLVVVLGLLAVAVVIALIGVANTLSLSVVERRQENALLRALGLTRRQLRWSLAAEGVLLALVGAVVGVLAGLVYGWIGSILLLGVATDGVVTAVIPWGTIGVVVLVAALAGVAASVLPARSATRVPPVVALGA